MSSWLFSWELILGEPSALLLSICLSLSLNLLSFMVFTSLLLGCFLEVSSLHCLSSLFYWTLSTYLPLFIYFSLLKSPYLLSLTHIGCTLISLILVFLLCFALLCFLPSFPPFWLACVSTFLQTVKLGRPFLWSQRRQVSQPLKTLDTVRCCIWFKLCYLYNVSNCLSVLSVYLIFLSASDFNSKTSKSSYLLT